MDEGKLKLISVKSKDNYIIKSYNGFGYLVKSMIWKSDSEYQVMIKPTGSTLFQPDVFYDSNHGGRISFQYINIIPDDWDEFIKCAENAINLCEELKTNKDLISLETK